MRMTPTAAMEVLLGHTTLHVIIMAKAKATICTLMCKHQWKPISTMVTLKILGHRA
jgi:hypothetical protein